MAAAEFNFYDAKATPNFSMDRNDNNKSLTKFQIEGSSEMAYPSQLVATELIPLPGCKSQFWRYFGFYAHCGKIIEAKKRVVVCKLCLREMAYSGNTSNLSSHLNSRHPREFAAAKALSHVDRGNMRYVSNSPVNEDTARFKLPSRHSPNASDASAFKMTIPLEPDPLPMKREAFTPAVSSPSTLSIPLNHVVPSPAAHSPLEEAVAILSVDLLISPSCLLASSAFSDLLKLLDSSVSIPEQLPLEPLFLRVREAVFPEERRRAEENFFALSIDIDVLGANCAQRTILHDVDVTWNASHVPLETTLCRLYGEPELWNQHVCRILDNWNLNYQSLVGVVAAGSWVETATAKNLKEVREQLSWPLLLPLEALLGRVVRRATAGTDLEPFMNEVLDGMKMEGARDKLLDSVSLNGFVDV